MGLLWRQEVSDTSQTLPCDKSLKKVDFIFKRLIFKGVRMATPAGFEPATYCLEGSCSIQLSYGI